MKKYFIFQKFFRFFGFSLASLLITTNAHASSLAEPVKPSLEQHYIEQIRHINQTLIENQSEYEAKPKLLAEFVDDSVLPLWNSAKTLRGLFGKKNWLALSSENQYGLVKGFNDTIQRYVQEGFSLYDGQQLEFVKLKLNKKQTRGLLTIKVIPNILPEFDVNFKIALENGQWQLYDILVQGVSYVTLKKDSFRNQYKNHGLNAVIKSIIEKNKGYVESRLAINSQEQPASSE